MDDLRTEIREAFESEQAAHPPAPDLRQRVAHRVVTQPGPRSSVQWVAVAVATLLALAVIAGLMSARTAQHRTVPVAPKPTAVADYGPPPAGVPLIYLADKNHPGWYTGFDWSGKPRGTIKLPPAHRHSLEPGSVTGRVVLRRRQRKGRWRRALLRPSGAADLGSWRAELRDLGR